MMRPVVGLVVVIALVFAVVAGTGATARPAAARVDTICQLAPAMDATTVDHTDCAASGMRSGCSAHSICVVFIMPTVHPVGASSRSPQWMWLQPDDLAGRSLPLSTPPPVPAA